MTLDAVAMMSCDVPQAACGEPSIRLSPAQRRRAVASFGTDLRRVVDSARKYLASAALSEEIVVTLLAHQPSCFALRNLAADVLGAGYDRASFCTTCWRVARLALWWIIFTTERCRRR